MPKPIPAHANGIERLSAIVHDLRSPGGCPWDMEQTHLSLGSNLIEEAYETLEAIQQNDAPHLQEELGDLLLQVVLHSEIASETQAFNLDQVAHGISEKLIRRHPHVYGETSVGDTAGVLRQWDEIKQAERASDPPAGYLGGITRGLTALTRSAKIQKKAAQVGFDWPDAASLCSKIHEELAEVEAEIAADNPTALAEEIGDLLFVVASLARKAGHDPEVLLCAANDKFVNRFHRMEAILLTEQGKPITTATQDEMEATWNRLRAEQHV
jgi:MazG family protein